MSRRNNSRFRRNLFNDNNCDNSNNSCIIRTGRNDQFEELLDLGRSYLENRNSCGNRSEFLNRFNQLAPESQNLVRQALLGCNRIPSRCPRQIVLNLEVISTLPHVIGQYERFRFHEENLYTKTNWLELITGVNRGIRTNQLINFRATLCLNGVQPGSRWGLATSVEGRDIRLLRGSRTVADDNGQLTIQIKHGMFEGGAIHAVSLNCQDQYICRNNCSTLTITSCKC